MKRAINFASIALFGFLLCLAIVIVMAKSERLMQTYHDQYFTGGEIRTFAATFSPHSGVRHYIKLKFNGRVYRDVEGFEPYYLTVPQIDAVLFVTVGKRYAKTFHIVDLKTHKELSIDGGTIYFGGNIGSGKRAGEDLSAWVERAESDRLILATRDGKVTTFISVDLKHQIITDVHDEHSNP